MLKLMRTLHAESPNEKLLIVDNFRHNAIATTLFSASVLGSFYYTMKYRRSAFVDATTLISGAFAANTVLSFACLLS